MFFLLVILNDIIIEFILKFLENFKGFLVDDCIIIDDDDVDINDDVIKMLYRGLSDSDDV